MAHVYFNTRTTPLYLQERATLEREYGAAVLTTTTGEVVTGDKLAMPAPLIIYAYEEASTHESLHSALKDIITKAKSASSVTYNDGTTDIGRRDVDGLLGWQVASYDPLRPLIYIILRFAPTSPYWINLSTSAEELWQW